jgi:hypothetical protein
MIGRYSDTGSGKVITMASYALTTTLVSESISRAQALVPQSNATMA